MNTHVKLPDMGTPYRSNFRSSVAQAALFRGVKQTSVKPKWEPAEPSSVYKAATKLLRQRLNEKAELARLQIRLARMHAEIEAQKERAACTA